MINDSENEQAIRDLIVRWAEAVHNGDLDEVLADHADDIVMFDVPPPEEGVRGMDAYRQTGRRSSSGSDQEHPSRSCPLR
jgi:ketosteroid isomerase-like protein